MDDLTVVYYTSNQESPDFEANVRKHLKQSATGIPIISVSQRPIDLGTNICVGDVGVSSHNAWRQLQIGAMEAKTRWVCTAEADFLYPRSYFEFCPPEDDVAYLAAPLYVLFHQRGRAKVYAEKPRLSEAAMVIGRDCLVDAVETTLTGYGMWGLGSANGETFPYLLNVVGKRARFVLDAPVVTFKTDRNMHRRTPHNTRSYARELPYWGNSRELIRRFFE
jgi:hypothetical protein